MAPKAGVVRHREFSSANVASSESHELSLARTLVGEQLFRNFSEIDLERLPEFIRKAVAGLTADQRTVVIRYFDLDGEGAFTELDVMAAKTGQSRSQVRWSANSALQSLQASIWTNFPVLYGITERPKINLFPLQGTSSAESPQEPRRVVLVNEPPTPKPDAQIDLGEFANYRPGSGIRRVGKS